MMKNILKNKKGFIDGETLYSIVIILIIVGMIGFAFFKWIYSRTAGNKTAVDMNYTFKKAIIFMNDEKIELDVKTWRDYDGEQIQIVTEDGKVYLTSAFNTILINE